MNATQDPFVAKIVAQCANPEERKAHEKRMSAKEERKANEKQARLDAEAAEAQRRADAAKKAAEANKVAATPAPKPVAEPRKLSVPKTAADIARAKQANLAHEAKLTKGRLFAQRKESNPDLPQFIKWVVSAGFTHLRDESDAAIYVCAGEEMKVFHAASRADQENRKPKQVRVDENQVHIDQVSTDETETKPLIERRRLDGFKGLSDEQRAARERRAGSGLGKTAKMKGKQAHARAARKLVEEEEAKKQAAAKVAAEAKAAEEAKKAKEGGGTLTSSKPKKKPK